MGRNGLARIACSFCAEGQVQMFDLEGPMAGGFPETYLAHLHDQHPLDCTEVREVLLPAYHAGRLDPCFEQRVILHIGSCAGCRGEYQAKYLMMRSPRSGTSGKRPA